MLVKVISIQKVDSLHLLKFSDSLCEQQKYNIPAKPNVNSVHLRLTVIFITLSIPKELSFQVFIILSSFLLSNFILWIANFAIQLTPYLGPSRCYLNTC